MEDDSEAVPQEHQIWVFSEANAALTYIHLKSNKILAGTQNHSWCSKALPFCKASLHSRPRISELLKKKIK